MSYSSEVLADSPLAYYRLGEGSGTTMVDSSGNGRDGTYPAPPTLGAASLLTSTSDTCANFNGASHYAATGPGSWLDTSTVTVEAWINPDATPAPLFDIASRDYGNTFDGRMWILRLTSARKIEWVVWTAGLQSTARVVTGTTILATGTSYHVAGTYDGDTMRVYLNGVLEASLAVSGVLRADTARAVTIAREAAVAQRYFDGRIDEVAIYGTALSAARVSAHYAAGAPPIIARTATLYGYSALNARTYRTGWLIPTSLTGWSARRRRDAYSGIEVDDTPHLAYSSDGSGRPNISVVGDGGESALYRLIYTGGLSLAGAAQVHVEWYLNGPDGTGATCKLIVNGVTYTKASEATVEAYRTRTTFDVLGVSAVTSVAVEWENLDDPIYKVHLERIDRDPEVSIPARAASLTGSGSFTASVRLPIRADLTGSGSFAATSAAIHTVSATLANSGVLSAIASVSQPAIWTGAGSFSAALGAETVLGVFSGSGILSASIVVVPMDPGTPGLEAGIKRWIFRDVTTGQHVVLPINPREMTTPTAPRNFQWAWSGPGMKIQGIDLAADQPAEWSFTGVILTKSHYDLLLGWAKGTNIVQITDHLDRTFETIIQKFDPIERLPTARREWRADYTMNCLLLRRVE